MDTITLNFDISINVSFDLGDVVFFQDSSDKVWQIGAATSKTATSITCDIATSTPRPTAGDFIFFAKSSEVNKSGLLGYYASVKMELSGAAKKELFAVSTEIFQSS
mgnify:FL=1|jgi:hypothetical protein|tara:strand:- start:8011 stop:8328 length:318 start_codon:yes stop_codon:yes gene_type:complete